MDENQKRQEYRMFLIVAGICWNAGLACDTAVLLIISFACIGLADIRFWHIINTVPLGVIYYVADVEMGRSLSVIVTIFSLSALCFLSSLVRHVIHIMERK